jgi:hypothetical protein
LHEKRQKELETQKVSSLEKLKNEIIQCFLEELNQDCYYNQKDILNYSLESFCKKREDLENLLEIIKILKAKKIVALFEDVYYCEVIIKISQLSQYFLRDLKQIKRLSYSPHKQIKDVIDFLFVKYKMPTFMYNVWKDPERELDVIRFIELANGCSVRNLSQLPISLTPKIAHYFRQAPDYVNFNQAIRYAQVRALGGDDYLAWYINESFLANNFRREEFWLSVIQFFVNNLEEVEGEYIFEMLAYINYEYQLDNNYSLKGRTFNSVLRANFAWRKTFKTLKIQAWQKSVINDFEYEVGNPLTEHYKKYYIKELLNPVQLVIEGSKMSHCVASYAESCVKGKSAIFSMQVEDFAYVKRKLLTIEVAMTSKKAVQIRGKYNRLPTETEKYIIQNWLVENNLTF